MIKPEVRPTLTITLKPQLQDYIRYITSLEETVEEDQMLIAKKGSYLGKLIFPFLQFRPGNKLPLLPDDKYHRFTFELPYVAKFEVRNNTAWISAKNQMAITRIVESHFRMHFRTFADDKVRYLQGNNCAKGSIQKVIFQFCSDINMQYDHVTFDMISKAYYRSRKKSDSRVSCTNKSMTIGDLFFLIN